MKHTRHIILTLALCLVMVVYLPLRADAATIVDSGKLGDFAEWTLDSDGTLTLFGRSQTQSYWAERLREAHESDIVHLVVNLDSLDWSPLNDLTNALPNLVSVEFADHYTDISNFTFIDCPKLESVKLPASLQEIPGGYFLNCPSLKQLTIPEGVTNIGITAFARSGIESITIPSSVKRIESNAFEQCYSLTSIVLQEGLEYLGERIFLDSPNLKILAVPSTTKMDWYCLSGSSIEDLTIRTTQIQDEYPISGLDTLKKLTIDAPTVPQFAFLDCENLSTVILTENVKTIESWAFRNCTSLESIVIPEGVETIYSAFTGSAIRELVIPGSVTTFTGSDNCPNLERVVLPESIKEISNFKNCPNLKEINLEHIEIINDNSFENCTALESIDLSSVTYIGYCAFQGCSSLTDITWPRQTADINHSVFMDCDSLVDVTWPATIPDMDSFTFGQCNNLQRITISEGVTNADLGSYIWNPSMKVLVVLDRNTEFGTTNNEDLPAMTVMGWEGSTAEQMARDNGFVFVALHDANHRFDLGTITSHPNCAQAGSMTFNCQDCNITAEVPIPTTGHNYVDVQRTQEAGIGTLGITRYTCPGCGDYYEETEFCRIYGANRYETSFSAADMLKAELGVEKFDTIIVAAGLDFADALTGSYLAAVKQAPILLVNQHFMDEVAAYVNANLASGGRVYLLGGELAIKPEMEEMLSGLDVKRLAGANRLETNLLILNEAGVGDDEILVCYSHGFADSLSASAVGKPILMVNNRQLTPSQKEFLAGADRKFVIIGGESAVSADMAAQLEAYGTIERIGGSNRYETSINVAKRFFSDPSAVVLAYGANFPDGLCGGPLAYAVGAPLILTRDVNARMAAVYTAEEGISNGSVLGGSGLISDEAVNTILHR